MAETTKPRVTRADEDAQMFQKGWNAGFEAGREQMKREFRNLFDLVSDKELEEVRDAER